MTKKEYRTIKRNGKLKYLLSQTKAVILKENSNYLYLQFTNYKKSYNLLFNIIKYNNEKYLTRHDNPHLGKINKNEYLNSLNF